LKTNHWHIFTFDESSKSLPPESIIPYDEQKRKEMLLKVLPKIQSHVEKWEHLKELGVEVIRRRFKRDSSERL
jgi:hypothetical protein